MAVFITCAPFNSTELCPCLIRTPFQLKLNHASQCGRIFFLPHIFIELQNAYSILISLLIGFSSERTLHINSRVINLFQAHSSDFRYNSSCVPHHHRRLVNKLISLTRIRQTPFPAKDSVAHLFSIFWEICSYTTVRSYDNSWSQNLPLYISP